MPFSLEDVTYLGEAGEDGLYVQSNGYDIEVFASDGMTKTNIIYIGPDEFQALLHFVKEKMHLDLWKIK